MDRRTYYFNLSWWFVFYFVGFLSIWAAYHLAVNTSFHPLTSIHNLIIDFLGILLLIFLILLGLLCVTTPLTLKIVLTSEGIEEHTLVAINKFYWHDITVRIPPNGSIENVSIKAKNPEIIIRNWTRFVPWDIEKGAWYNLAHQGIPIQQYGGRSPKKLVEELRRRSENNDLDTVSD